MNPLMNPPYQKDGTHMGGIPGEENDINLEQEFLVYFPNIFW